MFVIDLKCGIRVVIAANAGAGSGHRQLVATVAMGGRRSAHASCPPSVSCAASFVNIKSASSWSAGHACIQACSCSATPRTSELPGECPRAGKLPVGAIDGGTHYDMETHACMPPQTCSWRHVARQLQRSLSEAASMRSSCVMPAYHATSYASIGSN